VNSLPKSVTRQRRGCDLNPDPSAPESSTLTTRLPSHPVVAVGLLCPSSTSDVYARGLPGLSTEAGHLIEQSSFRKLATARTLPFPPFRPLSLPPSAALPQSTPAAEPDLQSFGLSTL